MQEGDVGTAVKLDRDGLHELNVMVDWRDKGGNYWVRYIHVELMGFPSTSSVATTEPASSESCTAVVHEGQVVDRQRVLEFNFCEVLLEIVQIFKLFTAAGSYN